MHFNGKKKRDELIAQHEVNPYDVTGRRFCVYIDLCIHPHSWDSVYNKLRQPRKIDHSTWNCLLGVINALLLSIRMRPGQNAMLINDVALDFVDFIRHDNVGDAWKFILSMRVYLRRYCCIKSLHSIGLDWRTISYEELGAMCKPSNKTFHSIFTSLYVRSFIKALVVFKQMRTVADADYELGVNDRHTLVARESASKKCLDYHKLDKIVQIYMETLPSWNTSIRCKACYNISYMIPLHELLEKQMLPSTQRKIGNGASD